MTTTTAAKSYTVRRYFNGEYSTDASNHRTLAAAQKAADKLNRSFGANGWAARIYLGDLRVDE